MLLRLPLANNVLRVVLRDLQTSHSIEPLAGDARTSRWEIRLALPVQELEDLEPDELEPEEEPVTRRKRRRRSKCHDGVAGVARRPKRWGDGNEVCIVCFGWSFCSWNASISQ